MEKGAAGSCRGSWRRRPGTGTGTGPSPSPPIRRRPNLRRPTTACCRRRRTARHWHRHWHRHRRRLDRCGGHPPKALAWRRLGGEGGGHYAVCARTGGGVIINNNNIIIMKSFLFSKLCPSPINHGPTHQPSLHATYAYTSTIGILLQLVVE